MTDNSSYRRIYTINPDGRGSTSVIVDSANNGVTGYRYDEFGGTEIVDNTDFNNEVCYTGQVYDKDTGDYYYNARYYSPDEGRFVTVDSYRGEFEEPLSLHLYAYCANNPVNYTDPSGHKYDRNKITKYVEKYAFNYNKNYPNFNTNDGGDCANFVSQCVRYGGIAKDKKWYCNKRKKPIKGKYGKWTWGKSWAVAPKLYSYMKKGRKVVNINKKKHIADKVKNNNIKKGDLIFFRLQELGVNHAGIVSSITRDKDIKYAGHNTDRAYWPLSKSFDTNSRFMKVNIVRM